MGRDGEPVLHHAKPRAGGVQKAQAPQTSDEFDSVRLALQWQWHANHQEEWYSLAARQGWLRLFPQPAKGSGAGMVPNLLLQKFPARTFMVETEMEPLLRAEGEEAGLVVMGAEHAVLGVRQIGLHRRVFFRRAGQDNVLQVHARPGIRLRLRVEDGGRCQFGFDDDVGHAVWVPEIFQARAGTWIGAKVGLYSTKPGNSAGGYADFDYFRFSPSQQG
jgi:beta-xylosidase